MKTKSVLLIGLGRFGKYIAMKLHELGHEIMAVDENEERINDAMPYVTNGQIGDSTNEMLLKSLGVTWYTIFKNKTFGSRNISTNKFKGQIMNNAFEKEAASVFRYFEKICAIPHGSGNMEPLSDYCLRFARENDLRVIRDNAKNVVIYKPGTAGYENAEPINATSP